MYIITHLEKNTNEVNYNNEEKISIKTICIADTLYLNGYSINGNVYHINL